ncbi:MAG: hypothetical protein M3450_20525, partial [Actinomycetota bacterium]|nr:hypothetical protein [Actinomycetota bacterium]
MLYVHSVPRLLWEPWKVPWHAALLTASERKELCRIDREKAHVAEVILCNSLFTADRVGDYYERSDARVVRPPVHVAR